MKKIFGELNITWKVLIISAVVIGLSVGFLNSVPFLYNSSISDVATYFDFWILCGILIISNSKSNKESALKCFVFFLISQPLIYLAEVPFNPRGWELFIYYKYWFIWTILTIPMGYIGYYIKKNKWYGLLILTPILILLSTNVETSLSSLIFSFPRHIIDFIFVVFTLIMYPLVLFDAKLLKYIGLTISILLALFFGMKVILDRPTYEPSIRCSSEENPYNENYKVYLEDKKYGEVFLKYEERIDAYCLQGKFIKSGKTKLTIEDPNGKKRVYDLKIGQTSYTLSEIE